MNTARRYRTSLVIGKFLPPHRGHKYLIDTATAQCERVTVILCGRPDDPVPPDVRADWLREIHPDVDVMEIEDTYDPDDSRLWAENCRRWLGYVPEAVFTSEDYGDPFARYLGSVHVCVDMAREKVPISGTKVRQNPLDHLDFLEPCVRAWYVLRVCVVGAESTGTTTMAQALAENYRTVWVPEYGRDYWVEKMQREGETAPWRTEEFVHIAQQQSAHEDALARQADRLLFCDTDAFATGIWHERYMGFRAPEVEAIGANRRYALTFLTDVDIPFVQDGTRDGEHLRLWMHRRFAEALEAQGRPYVILSGSHEERLQTAVETIRTRLL